MNIAAAIRNAAADSSNLAMFFIRFPFAAIMDTGAILKLFTPIVQAEALPLHNLRQSGYQKH